MIVKEKQENLHPILFGATALNQLSEIIAGEYANKQIIIITDENTNEYCLPILQQALSIEHIEVVQIPSGEENKTIEVCEQVWQVMLELGINRQALALNLGGGMITDIGGFAAATYKRGINFIHIPTTLMGMVDAAIGGKTGMNLGNLKNQVGVFAIPKAVVSYPNFLSTLSEREIKSGFAEIVKHALVADKLHWTELPSDISEVEWVKLVEHSYKIKAAICENDFMEVGQRKLLNFGHTIGHAIESYLIQGGEEITHGECVAAGIICETYLSVKAGLSEEDVSSINKYVLSVFGKIEILRTDIPVLIDAMYHDKKNSQKGINFTLLKEIGKGMVDFYCEEEEITDVLEYYIDL